MKSDTPTNGVLEAIRHPIQVVIRSGGERAYNGVLTALNEKKDEAAEGLVKASDTVGELCTWLDEHGPEQVAGYVQTGHEALAKLSSYVHDSEVEEIFEDAKDYARQNPVITAGTIFALGFLAGRIARSAAPKGGGENG